MNRTSSPQRTHAYVVCHMRRTLERLAALRAASSADVAAFAACRATLEALGAEHLTVWGSSSASTVVRHRTRTGRTGANHANRKNQRSTSAARIGGDR